MAEDKYKTQSGEDKAWRELAAAEPGEVEKNSLAGYDPRTRTYTLKVFGEDFRVDVGKRAVVIASAPGRAPEYLLGLSVPVYLVQARPVPPSGELVKELPGGEFFFRGSHTLPLDGLAARYARDRDLFLEAGVSLGGKATGLGDASFEFFAFPRISMSFVLWLEDDEFPARASLLFDSNAGLHMALDALWAAALVACQRMLKYAPAG